MTREAFRELVKKGPVLLDGATGTNLQKAGMPVGVCPEQWEIATVDQSGVVSFKSGGDCVVTVTTSSFL